MTAALDSNLSRVLLDEGLIAKRELEQAVQQQVIHGGALDTLLLELGLVEAGPLTAALSRAWDTADVGAADIDRLGPEVAAHLPERIAVSLSLCPLKIDDDSLHVLCTAPVDRGLLTEIGTLVRRPLVPRVIPEVRLQEALHRVYGVPLEERYASLLQLLESDHVPAPPESFSFPESAEALAPFSTTARQEWDLVEALANLAAQDNREGIAEVAVRYARQSLPFAAVFGVRNGRMVGWHRDGPADGPQFMGQSLPIPIDSVVQQVLDSPSPLVGRPAINDGNTALLGWLGRRRPLTALLVPIVVARRTVGILYADGGVRVRRADELSDLVSFAARLGPAFEALLRARHQAHGDLLTPIPAPPRFADPVPLPAAPLPVVHAVPEETTADYEIKEEPAPIEVAPLPQKPAPLAANAAADKLMEELADDDLTPVQRSKKAPAKDGTSPFAKTYTRTSPAPPREVPAPAPAKLSMNMDDSGAWNLVMDTAPGDAGAPASLRDWGDAVVDEPAAAGGRVALPGPGPSAAQEVLTAPPQVAGDIALGSFEDDVPAPPALDEDVSDAERGLWEDETGGFKSLLPGDDEARQTVDPSLIADARPDLKVAAIDVVESADAGADEIPVLASDDGWEDVVLDAAHAAELTHTGSQTPTPAAAVPDEVVADADIELEADDDADAIDIEPVEPARPLEVADLVGMLSSLHERRIKEATRQLLDRPADEVVPALKEAFPGRLVKDPLDGGELIQTAAELGPMIELLENMGPRGLDVAIAHLEAHRPIDRYAATFLFVLVPDERAIDLVRPRLHDTEPRIRQMATAALSYFIAHPKFVHVLNHLRKRLTSPVEDVRERAVTLLGNFRDVGSVPTLIKMLEQKGSRVPRAVRAALFEITLQDFGTKKKNWIKWWDKARKHNRIEWLLDGLRSRDENVRFVASNDLMALTGVDFGYRADEAKRQRESAALKYEQWWANEKAQRGMA